MADEPREGSDRAIAVVVWALAINLVIAGLKLTVALVTRSTGMLAEALHSLADTANQVFLLVGARLGARAPDEDHPFGYGGERYFWAFMAALAIFTLGGGLSVFEGGKRLLGAGAKEPIEDPTWAFVVLGASLLLEGASFVVALGEVRKTGARRGLLRTVRDARDPTILTVLFEDAAAVAGLVFAFGGVLLSVVTGDARWDGAGSVLVGLLLVTVAALLARSSKELLIGRSVPPAQRRRIHEIARAARDVLEVVHIRTVHLGPDEVMCGLKLRFTPTLDTVTLERRINELEASLREELPHLRRIYVEPGFDERAAPGREGASDHR